MRSVAEVALILYHADPGDLEWVMGQMVQQGNGGRQMSKTARVVVTLGLILIAGLFGWVFTAPYISNQGLGRTPGLIIGGTLAPAPDDFTVHDDYRGLMLFKQQGFPPLVNYLSWVATPDGIITATRPDGGYWAQRIRDGNNKAWLRLGDTTYAMAATEITGPQRLAMMDQWAAKSGRSLDEPLYPGAEPLRDWEVFFWESAEPSGNIDFAVETAVDQGNRD